MNHSASIEKITEEILANELDYLSLRNKLQDFQSFLLELTKMDLNQASNRTDRSFANGIALSSTYAALCVVDIIRTRQFVRGIFAAVKKVRSQKTKPVKILYAGTGPFATLILPLLTKYRSEELQLTLLEVNEETSNYLKRLIKKLGIEDYIEKIVNEDASQYQIDKNQQVDILISETMQYGLVKEQQVPIMLNLVSQLNKEVIMIPHKIQLDLALMNTDTELLFEKTEKSKYKILKTLLEFDQAFIYTHAKQIQKRDRFDLCERLPFRRTGAEDFDKLVVLTSIQVYGDHWVHVDLSSLTIPKELLDFDRIEQTKEEISLAYVIKRVPDFEYELF